MSNVLNPQAPLDTSGFNGLLDGLTNDKGQFDPMALLTKGDAASGDEVVAMAMDNTQEHFDLIGAHLNVLRTYGVSQAKLDMVLSDAYVAAARGRSAYAQRQALNTFWSLQLAFFGERAMRYRSRLITHGTAADWLRHFNEGPALFIKEFDLPLQAKAPMM